MNTKPPTLLSYAFRPFFLLNGVFAIFIVLVWTLSLHGHGLSIATPLWHSHEMLIGFSLATVAGFSLTAVANWTGRPAVHGAPLALLLISWVLGRLVMFFSGDLPGSLVFFLDMIFPVLLTIILGREIIAGRSQRNYPLIIIMLVIAVLNALYHMGAMHLMPGSERFAIYLLIHSLVLLVAIIAGRIVPAFTGNWLRSQGKINMPVNSDVINKMSLLLTVIVGLAATFMPGSTITGVLAIVAALVHGFRLSRWKAFDTISNPLLFVLHVAYFWLPLGYALLAFSAFGWVFSATAALHALTMGAIGSMILAVTTRVSLGHTGRPLQAARLTVFAYWVFMIAVLVRVFGPLSGTSYLLMIDISAVGWILSFAIFCWVYWPILTRARS